ncbi:MAG: ribonuclease PH [Chloroflexi bacterium]|nr:ribonuclease PH [Chloroflexota bacterium]
MGNRVDGRAPDELRPVRITPGYFEYAEGSALIAMGMTRVACAVTVEERLPNFLRGKGTGWITAEYGMLPRSTLTRTPREAAQGRVSGRSQEIQRLIGRALRAVTDLGLVGERTVLVDCDVLQADGGTRTAAITAAYVALYQAFQRLVDTGVLEQIPLRSAVAAVSVGVVNEQALLDLCYDEDSRAEVDFNVVMTDRDEYVELQGTAEGKPFSRASMDQILDLAHKGIRDLFAAQQAAIDTLRHG